MINKELSDLIKKRDKFMESHDFSKYSIEELEDVIGDHSMTELMDAFHNNEDDVIKWFYSPLPYFNGKTPNEHYKICKKDIENEIENLYNSTFGI